MMTGQYAYDVFISYRHVERDRAWAKWLLESLETYRVPKSLQLRGFPARINKVFRDEDELPTSADLSTNIQQALEGSKFLVVICSKDTPSSLWVDKEVQTFRKLGKGDHIIPSLVEGTPETSFPQSLLTLKKPVKQADGTIVESNEPLEPIAADVRERKDEKRSTLKRLALLRILSAILGCAFDDLRQRDQQRQARKKRIVYSVAAGLTLALVGTGLYLWDYNRVKVSYYNTMVYRWGVPEGVGRLNNKEKNKREHFTFMSKQNHVIRVRKENIHGVVPKYSFYEGDIQIFYNADGTVGKIHYINEYGNVILVKKYEHWMAAGRYNPDSSIIDLLNEYMMPSRQMSSVTWFDHRNMDITRQKVVYNENGYVVRLKYMSVFGAAKADPLGSHGKFYRLSGNGLPSEEWMLGPDGERAEGNGGQPVVKTKHDGMGNITEQSYWSPVDSAVIHPVKLYHRAVITYDSLGNLSSKAVYGCHGQPVLDEFGVHRSVFSHDPDGRWESEFDYGTDGRLVLGLNGFAGNMSKMDSLGRTVEKWYYGTDSTLMTVAYGFSSIKTFYYDENEQVIEERYYDREDKQVPGLFGVYRYSSRWNKAGKCTEQWYGDSLGKPMRSVYGYARSSSLFNEQGQKIEHTFYDIDGKMVKLDHGYAKDRNRYDEKGNLVEQTYYNEYDKATIIKKGYHKVAFRYDEWGNIIEESYFGLKNEAVNNKDGYARVSVIYDEKGDIRQALYYDKKGRPVTPKKEKMEKRKIIIL